MASLTTPLAPDASMDKAPINTVGMLFITEDSRAERRPVPMAAPHTPPCAKMFSSDAMSSVSPALRKP
ncbi:hypothetical protein D3C86_2071860 [compost metagenome]